MHITIVRGRPSIVRRAGPVVTGPPDSRSPTRLCRCGSCSAPGRVAVAARRGRAARAGAGAGAVRPRAGGHRRGWIAATLGDAVGGRAGRGPHARPDRDRRAGPRPRPRAGRRRRASRSAAVGHRAGQGVALAHGLPIIAVPTTYAGSEMTPIWGLTETAQKRTGRDPRVLPKSVVYDPELTLGLPVDLSVTSGINAVAHAVEALYAPDASPVISLMAEEGVRALTEALPDARPLERTTSTPEPRPVRRLAVRSVPGRDDDVAAPQALPRPRRHPRPAARADPHRRAAARAGLQPARRTADRRRPVPGVGRHRRPRARPCGSAAASSGPPRACARLGMAETDIPGSSTRCWPPRTPTRSRSPSHGLTRLLRGAWAGDPPGADATPDHLGQRRDAADGERVRVRVTALVPDVDELRVVAVPVLLQREP